MANIIKIIHPAIDENEDSVLTADVASGASTLTVKNIHKIVKDDYLLIGDLGDETSEIGKVSANPTGHSIGVSTLSQGHSLGDRVYRLSHNKAKIYRATSATGTFTVLATVDIDVDEEYTFYADTTGTSSNWYKATFFNSTTSDETSLTSATPVRGEIELNAIPGSRKANSFITLEMAEAEIDQLLNNDVWVNANYRERARALIMATNKINSFRFRGDSIFYDQKLKFPNNRNPLFSGSANSGTVSTIVCSALIDDEAYTPDFWEYSGIRITEGTGKHSEAMVKSYDYLTGTLTLYSNLSATPDTTTQFTLTYKVPDEIRTATAMTALWLLQSGNSQENPNVQSRSVGKTSVTYFGKSEQAKLPDDILVLINPYISRVAV